MSLHAVFKMSTASASEHKHAVDDATDQWPIDAMTLWSRDVHSATMRRFKSSVHVINLGASDRHVLVGHSRHSNQQDSGPVSLEATTSVEWSLVSRSIAVQISKMWCVLIR